MPSNQKGRQSSAKEAEGKIQSLNILQEVADHAIGLSLENSVYCQFNLNQLYPAIVAEAIKIIKKA